MEQEIQYLKNLLIKNDYEISRSTSDVEVLAMAVHFLEVTLMLQQQKLRLLTKRGK